MKRICVSYAFWYNKKYQRCGNLFQDRFRSETVENDSYFLTVLSLFSSDYKKHLIYSLNFIMKKIMISAWILRILSD
ncbi:MAG TPA: hypothetical protein VFC70_04040 [Oscillospiraceae bacterium]|nr:hypothetical protein [Oscillospiraceae bacterium]